MRGATQVTVRKADTPFVEQAAECLALAFALDPITNYFFPEDAHADTRAFFDLLMRVRIALDQPALLAMEGERVLGAAMGYAPHPPPWPEPFDGEWEAFEGARPGLAERFEVYDGISERFRPQEGFHYLGVIGVHPEAQGRGLGVDLISAFQRLAREHPTSTGVYLDTGNPASREFYHKRGFVTLGEGDLGGTPLWCMFAAV